MFCHSEFPNLVMLGFKIFYLSWGIVSGSAAGVVQLVKFLELLMSDGLTSLRERQREV